MDHKPPSIYRRIIAIAISFLVGDVTTPPPLALLCSRLPLSLFSINVMNDVDLLHLASQLGRKNSPLSRSFLGASSSHSTKSTMIHVTFLLVLALFGFFFQGRNGEGEVMVAMAKQTLSRSRKASCTCMRTWDKNSAAFAETIPSHHNTRYWRPPRPNHVLAPHSGMHNGS